MASTPRYLPATRVERVAADSRLWRGALVVAVLLPVMYALIPTEQVVVRALVVYPLADLAALTMILVGVRRYRPRAPSAWRLVAAGVACFGVADVIYGLNQVAGTQPFPSAADVFYLAAYPLFAIGLHVASRARLPEGDRGTFIDASIVTVTGAMFAFLLIADQYVNDPDLPLLPTVVASAYPLADVLLLAVVVRFLLSVSWRVPSLQLLAAGMSLILTGDVVYSLNELFTQPGDSRSADTLLMAGVLALGLAGVHPSMTELTREPAELRVPQYSVTRVVSLYMVSMVPVLVLAVQALLSNAPHAWITIVALVLITSLVLARFVDMASQTRAASAREVTLSQYSSRLLVRSRREDLLAAAARAAHELAPAGNTDVVEHPHELDGRFVAPVVVDGQQVAAVVADAEAATLRGTRDGLLSVARGLALALERDKLLAAQAEAAASLAAQNAQLRELDLMKDQLVSSVSHELRTPLTSLGGYAELLLDEEEVGPLNSDQRRFAEVIDRNCRRLNRLIDDILFVSRVDAGRLSLERSWVDLAQVAASSLETARVRAEQSEVAAALVVGDDVPLVWADAVRMTQMFDNLISNAVKFTPPGGTITVTVNGTADGVRIEVADTGMGIPQDEVGRLFERFFRTSTVGAVAGTGLGLSIVKSIVEVHDGTIDVTSTEGAGTTFRVELPARPSSDGEASPPKEGTA